MKRREAREVDRHRKLAPPAVKIFYDFAPSLLGQTHRGPLTRPSATLSPILGERDASLFPLSPPGEKDGVRENAARLGTPATLLRQDDADDAPRRGHNGHAADGRVEFQGRRAAGFTDG